MTLAAGTTLGRYQILEPLGSGGMATVYKAYEPSLDRTVALKVIRPGLAEEEGFLARFRREAQAVAKLRHPNIVHVLTFDETDGRYFLAMDYLEGGTLKDRIESLDPGTLLAPAEVSSIVGQVADALGYAHEQGVIHRDIKPSNIMLTGKGRAIVTDFGIAKIVSGAALTQTGVGIGTPEYMSPEQGAGSQVDARADVYSLGVVAYELLTGRVPYLADTPFAIVAAHMRDPLPLPSSINPAVPAAAERALLKALAKQPAQRFASATEFATVLGEGLRGAPAIATMATIAPARAKPQTRSFTFTLPALPRSRPALAAIGAALMFVVAGTGAAISGTFGRGEATSPPSAVAATATATPVRTGTPVAATAAGATAPKFAVPAKGKLLFEAKLDGTGSDMGGRTQTGDTAATAIRQVQGAIELEVVKPSTFGGGRVDCQKLPDQCVNAGAAFNMPRVANYVGELDLTVAPASDVVLSWQLSNVRGALYYLSLSTVAFDGGEGGIVLGCNAPACPTDSVISNSLASSEGWERGFYRMPGLLGGKSFTLAVVVEEKQITVFLDQKRLGTIATPTPLNGVTLSSLQIKGPNDVPGKGLVRVIGARFYELPAAAAATAGAAAATPAVVPVATLPPPTVPPTAVPPSSIDPNAPKVNVSGRVTGAVNGAPLAGVQVQFGFATQCCVAGGNSRTDSSGAYTLAVPAGSYKILVTPPDTSSGYAPSYYGGANDYAHAQAVTVGSAPVSGIDVALRPGFLVSGRAVSQSGGNPPVRPKFDVGVGGSVFGDSWVGYGFGAPSGTYGMRLPAGTYTIWVWREDRQSGDPFARFTVTVTSDTPLDTVVMPP